MSKRADLPANLTRSMTVRRGVEAIIWGMPLVNFDLMHQAMVRGAKGRSNQVLYWSRLLDWKCQFLTPNTDLIYLMPFVDTKDVGPVVIEIPPAGDGVMNGTVMDAWQMPLEDVGPAGVDGGKGGKYLFLPPGYADAVPAGYIPLRSLTYKGYGLMRSILGGGSDADIAKAVAYGRRIKVYPLSQASAAPPTTFVDADGVLLDATIPYDLRFFESLDRMVQAEPWLQRDRTMIDSLRSLGIRKGKLFAPDVETRTLLDTAAVEAYADLDARFEAIFTQRWHASSRWAFPTSFDLVEAMQSGYADPDVYPIDDRGVLFSFIFFSPKRLVEGQFYLMSHRDAAGEAFDGGKAYRLVVPPNAPVRQYWSATLYDRATHGLIRNMPRAARSSQSPGLTSNPDGSVELHFGPQPPKGGEANWVPTNPGRKFEILFRFYGPLPPVRDRTWVLPDVEEVR